MSGTISQHGTLPLHGTIALQGGGAFTANDELDRRLLASVGADRVVVLPTADAFERPEKLVAAAMAWGERMGVEVEALMVMRRSEALEVSAATVVRNAKAVYFVGDQPIHLRSVMKDTAVWDALRDVLTNGGLVTATGGSAAGMCDPMVDPRGGAFTLGLGLVPNLALVTEAESWSPERLHRTRELANTAFCVLRTGDALVHTQAGWETVGGAEVHGDLP